MDLYKVHELFKEIEYCKCLCQPGDKSHFVTSVRDILAKNLQGFIYKVEHDKELYKHSRPSPLEIETLESVEEIFDKIRQILHDAVYLNTQYGYMFMEYELANLYSPAKSKVISTSQI